METIKRLCCAEQLLTIRELEIYELFGMGRSPQEIGKILFISPKTVSTHRTTILEKMGFKNLYELMFYAIRHKLVMHWQGGINLP